LQLLLQPMALLRLLLLLLLHAAVQLLGLAGVPAASA
jgi:hypothetical protein